METSYIVTFIGDDRPGLVEQLARVINASGGNWHESRLSQLGGKFAGLILVSLPEGIEHSLEADLKALSSSGLSVRVTATHAGRVVAAARHISLSVVGPDRTGIVREISSALAARQVNVLEMDTEVHSAPMSGEPLFQASIEAQIPEDIRLEDISEALDEIANEMGLEIDLEAL